MPRNAAEDTTVVQPRSSVGADRTMSGATRPTIQPRTAMRLRPCLSARLPTMRLHIALNTAKGTRKPVLLP